MFKTSESNVEASRLLREILRETRISAQLKQADLANLLGSYPSFVSKYESGERRLDVIELSQVCKALNITVNYVLNEIDNRSGRGNNAP